MQNKELYGEKRDFEGQALSYESLYPTISCESTLTFWSGSCVSPFWSLMSTYTETVGYECWIIQDEYLDTYLIFMELLG